MSDNKLGIFSGKCCGGSTSKQVRRSGYTLIVVGVLFGGMAGWGNKKAHDPSFAGFAPVQSVQVLTKSRPVVREWISVVSPHLVELSTISMSMGVFGLVFLMAGFGSLGNAKLVARVEKLEETLATREPPGVK